MSKQTEEEKKKKKTSLITNQKDLSLPRQNGRVDLCVKDKNQGQYADPRSLNTALEYVSRLYYICQRLWKQTEVACMIRVNLHILYASNLIHRI